MIHIFLVDEQRNKLHKIFIRKPDTFQKLVNEIKRSFQNLPESFIIYYLKANQETQIKNDDELKKCRNGTLFVREKERAQNAQNDQNAPKKEIAIKESIFSKKLKELSEEQKELITNKYLCLICSEIIKREKPYMCYTCQKLFHHDCLKNWAEACKSKRKILTCPNCRSQKTLKDWKEKIDFEELKENDVQYMELITNYKESESQKIVEKTRDIFKKILKKFDTMQVFKRFDIDFENSENLIGQLSNSSPFEEIENKINDKFNLIKSCVTKKVKGKENDEYNKFYDSKDYPYEFNLIHYTHDEGEKDIFGKKFAINNKNNIDLIINGMKIPLTDKYLLKKGENKIKVIVKRRIQDHSYMFDNCSTLKDIKELKSLYVKNAKCMFRNCSILSDISTLETWNVSNCTNFQLMFFCCSALKDLSPLKNWDISNAIDLTGMFESCLSIKSLNGLENWKISKCSELEYMFWQCESLVNITSLQNWDVSHIKAFGSMFALCYKLSHLSPLLNWDVSNGEYFEGMFEKCYELKDIRPLQYWKPKENASFRDMFKECKFLGEEQLKILKYLK